MADDRSVTTAAALKERRSYDPSSIVRDPARLGAVHASGLLDSQAEEAFDRLTRLAARITGAPVTFISLVDDTRDFYKSCFGFPEPLASERQITGTTFCHFAITSDGPLVIDDTLADPVYRAVPTVQTLGVRAYLGLPLITSDGIALGSFCAIDFKPRHWTPLDIEVLQELAASTMREIELRASIRAAKKDQETLHAERSRLKVILEQVPAGVVVAESATGRIVIRNRQAEEILGSSSPLTNVAMYAERVGYHADGTPMKLEEWPLIRALAGEVVHGAEFLYERPDGKRVWLRLHAAPIRDDSNEIIGAIVVFHDFNDQRRMQIENTRLYEEAKRANSAKDEFFAALSHELRTPMTSILGWARVLETEPLNNPTAVEAAQMIRSSAALQAKLVDDLLDVSRIATGKLTLLPTTVDINESIVEAVKAAQPAAESKGVRLRTSLAEVPAITADPGRMRQVIGNLLANAIKFTPGGGLVEVDSSVSGAQVVVRVRDTGRGIEAELLPHVFERHRQASNAEQGGLGLGLTIVHHLVELHSGVVEAASEGPGKGATFTIKLPV